MPSDPFVWWWYSPSNAICHPPGRLYFFMLHARGRHLFVSLTLPMFSDSWGLIKQLEDVPLLKVETALVNASHCQDLLSPTNLLGSGLVDVVVGMDNKILSAMSRKRARGSSDSRTAPTPQKKNNVGPLLQLERMAERSFVTRALRSVLNPEIELRRFRLRTRVIIWPCTIGIMSNQWGSKWLKTLRAWVLASWGGSVQRVSFKLGTLISCYKNRSMCHERKL